PRLLATAARIWNTITATNTRYTMLPNPNVTRVISSAATCATTTVIWKFSDSFASWSTNRLRSRNTSQITSGAMKPATNGTIWASTPHSRSSDGFSGCGWYGTPDCGWAVEGPGCGCGCWGAGGCCGFSDMCPTVEVLPHETVTKSISSSTRPSRAGSRSR